MDWSCFSNVFLCFFKALDGFFLVMLTDGNIIYTTESVTSLLEHLPVSESWQIVCSLFKDLFWSWN